MEGLQKIIQEIEEVHKLELENFGTVYDLKNTDLRDFLLAEGLINKMNHEHVDEINWYNARIVFDPKTKEVYFLKRLSAGETIEKYEKIYGAFEDTDVKLPKLISKGNVLHRKGFQYILVEFLKEHQRMDEIFLGLGPDKGQQLVAELGKICAVVANKGYIINPVLNNFVAKKVNDSWEVIPADIKFNVYQPHLPSTIFKDKADCLKKEISVIDPHLGNVFINNYNHHIK